MMANAQRVRIAGWCGIVGGVMYFLQELAGRVFIPQSDEPGTFGFVIGGVIATVALSLLLIGFLGLNEAGALVNRLRKGVGEALPVVVTGTRPEPLLNAAWGLCGALLGLAATAAVPSCCSSIAT